MNKTKRTIRDIFARYLLMILAALSNLWIFYAIFTPLTVYPVYWLTSIFLDVLLVLGHIPLLLINYSIPIELVPACIAGAAYYLLFILNLSVPKITPIQRFKMLLFAFGSLLILNILRIILMIFLYVQEYPFFDVTHTIFWYGISTIFVVGIWFAEVKIYKIKDIPVYSDLKFIFSLSKKTRKQTKKKSKKK